MSVSPNCAGAPSCAATLTSALIVLRRVVTVEVVGWMVMIGRFPGGLVRSSCTVGRGPRVLYLEGTSHTPTHTATDTVCSHEKRVHRTRQPMTSASGLERANRVRAEWGRGSCTSASLKRSDSTQCNGQKKKKKKKAPGGTYI
jgi:hypothetical protein